MTKKALIAELAAGGLSKRDAAKVVDAIFVTITEALQRGESVSVPGFGEFHPACRVARQGINPASGERLSIASQVVPRVRFAPDLLSSAPRRSFTRSRSPAYPSYGTPETLERGASSRGRPSPPAPPTPSGKAAERHINAWVRGRSPAAPRIAPLEPGTTYTLNLGVGALRATGLVEGDTRVDGDALPDHGLDTTWILSSTKVKLEPIAHEAGVSVEKGPGRRTTARFELHIPKEGESEVRAVAITARKNVAPLIDVTIRARGETYRQLTIRLDVADAPGAKPARRPGAATVLRQFIHAPAGQLGLRPPHEWQTPPAKLRVQVSDKDASVYGSTGAGLVDQRVQWFAWGVQANSPIVNLRVAADRFRAALDAYLNDIPAGDLEARFALGPRPVEAEPTPAFPRHEKAWRAARKSPELRRWARAGYDLYDRVFPGGSELRGLIDGLPPGARLDVTWLNDQPNYVAQVPWTLMYMKPGGPVDPMAFLGLRFRLGYTTHPVKRASRGLGAAPAVKCGNFLYWGSGADPTAIEAAWQRTELGRRKDQLFWPAAGGQKPKAELLKALRKPSPSPVAVLYLFCQSSFGDVQTDPLLVFDDPETPDTSIGRYELDNSPLREQPLVFANACTTVATDPLRTGDLQESFFSRGSRAFLGTETKVPIPMASRFARVFFHYFYREADPAPMAAGEAVWQARQFLWRHYLNLGGLFYSYVNQYELFFADDAEVEAMVA